MTIDILPLEERNRELHKKLRELEDLRDSIKRIINELTPSIANFSQIAMPLVARSFPALVMNDLVGVQPMCASPGLKEYALKHTYKDNKWSDHLNLPTIDEPTVTLPTIEEPTKNLPTFITDKKKAKLVKELLRNEQKWLSLYDL
jgi:hypothetical protein